MTDSTTLSKPQIRAVLRRNRGAAAGLARKMGVSQVNITQWLAGRLTSKRVEAAIRTRAAELLAAERADKAVA